jgi:isoleucyl-tRNA synthetase
MYVAFDVADGKGIIPNDAKIVIWTTTPWTIPADLAITSIRSSNMAYSTPTGANSSS